MLSRWEEQVRGRAVLEVGHVGDRQCFAVDLNHRGRRRDAITERLLNRAALRVAIAIGNAAQPARGLSFARRRSAAGDDFGRRRGA
jgi:hypothetical protein